MTASLERRLRQFRSRVLVRSWGYRQRHHARGVWFRLRRALADARDAYAITMDAARALEAEGYGADAVGQALEPPRLILRVPSERMAMVEGARPLAVRLSRELLAAEALALVPFDFEVAHRPQ